MNTIVAAAHSIENHVYMKAIINETGATSEAEALTAVRAMTSAMREIMDITGAPDTKAAVETVANIVMVLKESALRRMEEPTEVLVYAS